jgi:hypothetical protein
VEALQKAKKSLLEASPAASISQSNQATRSDTLKAAMEQCLVAALQQWGRDTPRMSVYDEVDGATHLVELSLITGLPNLCTRTLQLVLNTKGEKEFYTFYSPLITQLRKLGSSHEFDIYVALDGFLQYLIGWHLSAVLSSKPQSQINWSLPKVGCGCQDCVVLDTFMLSGAREHRFNLTESRRWHLELRLMSECILVTCTTIGFGSPHTLVVTKRFEATNVGQWEHRQREAKVFLAAIGDDRVIAKLMGPRYTDVQDALEGKRPFTLDTAFLQTNASSAILPESATDNSLYTLTQTSEHAPTTSQHRTIAEPPSSAAGHKRKTHPTYIGEIDLTEDD